MLVLRVSEGREEENDWLLGPAVGGSGEREAGASVGPSSRAGRREEERERSAPTGQESGEAGGFAGQKEEEGRIEPEGLFYF